MRTPEPSVWIENVLKRYEKPLLGYAASLLGNTENAKDAVQETFLKLSRENWAALEEKLAPWLFTVCRNLCLDSLRREKRMLPMDEATFNETASPDPGPDQLAGAGDISATLRVQLAQLPPNQQEIIRLKFEAGLSYREIADVTRLSVGNVGFLLHTAIHKLRADWPRESIASL